MPEDVKTIAIDTSRLLDEISQGEGGGDSDVPRTIKVDSEAIVQRLQEEREAAAAAATGTSAPAAVPTSAGRDFPLGIVLAVLGGAAVVAYLLLG